MSIFGCKCNTIETYSNNNNNNRNYTKKNDTEWSEIEVFATMLIEERQTSKIKATVLRYKLQMQQKRKKSNN